MGKYLYQSINPDHAVLMPDGKTLAAKFEPVINALKPNEASSYGIATTDDLAAARVLEGLKGHGVSRMAGSADPDQAPAAERKAADAALQAGEQERAAETQKVFDDAERIRLDAEAKVKAEAKK